MHVTLEGELAEVCRCGHWPDVTHHMARGGVELQRAEPHRSRLRRRRDRTRVEDGELATRIESRDLEVRVEHSS